MRCKTERNPVCTTLISGVSVPYNQGFRPKIPPIVLELLRTHDRPKIFAGDTKTCGTQSVLRETETQTDPFAPELKKPYRNSLEVLTLSWLSWNNGLPAGMREVTVIERARQKKAWNRSLPAPFNAAASSVQSMILEAIELNEWNHREIELAALSSARMDLARKCMEENLSASKIEYKRRLFKYVTVKLDEKDAALEKVRFQLKRNLRRLTYRHEGVNRKYYRWNVWQELEDKTSEWRGPQQRFGVHPRRGHEIIPKHFRFWNVFSKADIVSYNMEIIPRPENNGFDYVNKSKPRPQLKQLCVRETKWTPYELERLYNNLNAIRQLRSKDYREMVSCNLRQKIVRNVGCVNLPTVQAVPDAEEEACQIALTFQKLIKGRAIQAVMFEGRVRCQELLEEIKSTHALQGWMQDVHAQTRHMMYAQQRRAETKSLEEKRKNEILLSLEGKTVAEILDFLSKELLRIQNERETHAIALLAERERNEKEAAEAGRRQREDERSREHEEMWKQICKLFQNSLDTVVEDFVLVARNRYSAEEARRQATEYAKKIDQAAMEAHLRRNQLEEEEIIADLVYNFALPEAEKEMVRSRLKDKHRLLLTTCHNEIYSEVERVVKGARSPSGRLVPLPRHKARGHEKKPFVTYLKLARQSGNSTLTASISSLSGTAQTWQNLAQTQQPGNSDSDRWSTGFSRQKVVID